MFKKWLFSADGMAHIRPAQGDIPRGDKRQAGFGPGFSKEVADVCLNCTKKECRGGYSCYTAHRERTKE